MTGNFCVLKVEANAVGTQARVREAANGRYDRRRPHIWQPSLIKAIGPVSMVCRALQAIQIFLPCRVGSIELTTETKPRIEIRVIEERASQRHLR